MREWVRARLNQRVDTHLVPDQCRMLGLIVVVEPVGIDQAVGVIVGLFDDRPQETCLFAHGRVFPHQNGMSSSGGGPRSSAPPNAWSSSPRVWSLRPAALTTSRDS